MKLINFPVAIVDNSGQFISEIENLSEIFSLNHESDTEEHQCQQEFQQLLEKIIGSKEMFLSSCNAGLTRFAAPIILSGEQVGAVIGCKIDPPSGALKDKESASLETERLHIKDRGRFSDVIKNIPVMSDDELKEILGSAMELIGIFFSDELELGKITREMVNNYTEISLLYEIGDIFAKGLDVEHASEIVLGRVLELMEAQRVSLMLIDKETNELKIVYSRGLPEEVVKNTRLKLGEGIAGFVAKDGKPLLVENIEDNPKLKELIVGKDKIKSGSFLSAPLICSPLKVENKVIGVVNITEKKSGKSFTQNDLNMLSAIGSQLAAIIENKRLFTDIKELFITTVRALSLALDAKDHYTYGHSQRVTEYALIIASEMNLSDEERYDIELAGLLHDIGKIGIPEAILLKSEKLTNEELNEIRKHPSRGAEILAHIRQLSDIIPGILYHHEHYNGSGYPVGLKREEIPLVSRILAVADAFDAMTSARPYRSAFSVEYAFEEIKKNAGAQFDPQVAEVFLNAHQKGNV